MIYFTKYAEQKFDILNTHKVYIRKEEVEAAVMSPEKRGRMGKLLSATRNNIKVIYSKEATVNKVITFYPL